LKLINSKRKLCDLSFRTKKSYSFEEKSAGLWFYVLKYFNKIQSTQISPSKNVVRDDSAVSVKKVFRLFIRSNIFFKHQLSINNFHSLSFAEDQNNNLFGGVYVIKNKKTTF
jgi:hypothetical protein